MSKQLLTGLLAGILTLGTLPASAQLSAVTPPVEPGSKPPPAPKLVCEEATYNFGKQENTRDVEHTFTIRNDGDLTLEITQAKPACGCTVASVTRNSVPPGETTEIATKLSLRGRQGHQRKAITVQSNDPNQPTTMLYIEGDVVTEVNLNPRSIFFGRISAESVVTGAVELTAQGSAPVQIRKLETSTPMLTVTNEVVEDGRKYRISIVTQPPLPKGTLRANVRLETDHPQYPAMDVIVSGFVVGDVTYAPEQIDLAEEPEKRVTRYVLIRSEGAKAFEISSVEVPIETMGYQIQPTGPSAYRIELNNITPVNDLNGKPVRIVTSLAPDEPIVIPFRIIAAP